MPTKDLSSVPKNKHMTKVTPIAKKQTKLKKAVTLRTVLRRAAKKGADHSLFLLWLDATKNEKHKKLKEIWSNSHKLFEEVRKEKQEYGVLYYEQCYEDFKKEVEDAKRKRQNSKKKKKKMQAV